MTATTFLLIVLGAFIIMAIIFAFEAFTRTEYEIYVQKLKGWKVIDRFLNYPYRFQEREDGYEDFIKRIEKYEKKFPLDTPRSFVCVKRGSVTLLDYAGEDYYSHSTYVPKATGVCSEYVPDVLILGNQEWNTGLRIMAENDQHALQQFFSSPSFWNDDLVEWRLRKISEKNISGSVIASGKGPRYLKVGKFIKGGGTNCSELRDESEKELNE